MNPLKRLATQTAVYGVSSIVGRFLNYLLVPLFTYYFSPAEYGVVSEFYAYTGFLAVVLVFGLETGYFRFRDATGGVPDVAYSTALRFLLAANLGFLALIALFDQPIADGVTVAVVTMPRRAGRTGEWVAWTGQVGYEEMLKDPDATQWASLQGAVGELVEATKIALTDLEAAAGVNW